MQFGHLNYILFSTHESFGHLAAEHQKRAISQRGGGGLNKHLHKKIINAQLKRLIEKNETLVMQKNGQFLSHGYAIIIRTLLIVID